MDSRIFIKGLPPNYTDEELAKHFAMRYQITDAQVIPGRGIGFVGYRNYTLAKNAIQYFDKSYIKMHKISCSMAEPVQIEAATIEAGFRADGPSKKKLKDRDKKGPSGANEDPLPNAPQNESRKASFQPYTPVTKVATNLKRKREGGGADEDGAALKEYLDVMKPPTKSKTWANDEVGCSTGLGSSEGAGDRQNKANIASNLHGDQELLKREKKNKKSKSRVFDETQAAEETPVVKSSATRMKENKRKKSKLSDETQVVGEILVVDSGITTTKDKRSKKPKVPDKTVASEEVLVEESSATTSKEEKRKKKKSKENPKDTAIRNGGKSLDTDEDSTEELHADPDQPIATKSDADWLHSKTSRLLGLLDDEELANIDTTRPEMASSEESSQQDVSPKEASDHDVSQYGREQKRDETDPSDESTDANVHNISANGRLFVRNLPYTATDADLYEIFSHYGKLDEVHVAFDSRSESSKGFAYIQFFNASDAIQAYKELDRKGFQGRLLHILPASAKNDKKLDEYEISNLPLKKQKQLKRKADASKFSFSWNSLYMNVDSVMASVADRLGLLKSEVLDPTSSDAAVKQAHAETHIIRETKAYFSSHGVNLDAFKSRQRGDKAILVKNFSYGVKNEDLQKLFGAYGKINRFLMPPSGTIAIAEFERVGEAQQAFTSLAYKKLGDSILFLEKAPQDLFTGTISASTGGPSSKTTVVKPLTTDVLEREDQKGNINTSTLFVRNLNFSTTTTLLSETFKSLDGYLSAKVKTKTDPKKPGETLSMGFGFIEFRTKAQAQNALAAMNGYKLEGHELLIKASHKGMDAAEERRNEDNIRKFAGRRAKIIIKNLPFEASKKDVRALFGSYGQLRSVRVPKKFDSSTRGFAFADFMTAREAENAMDALRNTHLLGRKLVLEFATEDTIDPEQEIEKMQKKVGRQVDRVAVQKLTGSGRKKFNIAGSENAE